MLPIESDCVQRAIFWDVLNYFRTCMFTTDVVLHGDCTAANVLVRGGRVVALLDFEWSRRGPETSR
jgi:Ser/Thr protein kinase RdoA (MazF antagonist)